MKLFVIHAKEQKVINYHISVSTSVSTKPLQLIFSDVWGPALYFCW